MKKILTLLISFLIPIFSQDINNKLGTSGNYEITDSNGYLLMRLQSDAGVYFGSPYAGTGGTIPMEGVGTRMMWHPNKSAFRAGFVDGTQWNDVNIGTYSVAIGFNTIASGLNAVSIGCSNTAGGNYSAAFGYGVNASGGYSTAMGYKTTASGSISTAMGQSTIASGDYSTAIGYSTNASGRYSTAMGRSTTASGNYSTAIGYSTNASGSYSTAMGRSTTASGNHSTAFGYGTNASGAESMAVGQSTTASGDQSTAMGFSTTASGWNSTAMGRSTIASGSTSTAMGFGVSTNNQSGSFIIGDASTTSTTNSSTTDEMTMRFAGGYRLFTNSGGSVGASLAASANSWSTISDSTKKENYQKVDGEYFLNSISKLKLGSWNYKSQDSQIRHYGPMAQEIFNYFGKDDFGIIGNDTTLATADMDGIMMIAIQALINENEELIKKNNLLENRLEAIEYKLGL